jgi:hypothetical protein
MKGVRILSSATGMAWLKGPWSRVLAEGYQATDVFHGGPFWWTLIIHDVCSLDDLMKLPNFDLEQQDYKRETALFAHFLFCKPHKVQELICARINLMHRDDNMCTALERHLERWGCTASSEILIEAHVENGTIDQVDLRADVQAKRHREYVLTIRRDLKRSGKALAYCLRHHGVLKEMRIEILKVLWDARKSQF